MVDKKVGETDLGSFLKRLRERHGLSLRQVGLKTGVSHSYLSQVENQGIIPSAQILSKLSSVYKMDITVLLGEAGLMPKRQNEHKAPEEQVSVLPLNMPPGLKDLTTDISCMEYFEITPFEITRIAEFNFKRGAKLTKKEFLLLILFLRQINA